MVVYHSKLWIWAGLIAPDDISSVLLVFHQIQCRKRKYDGDRVMITVHVKNYWKLIFQKSLKCITVPLQVLTVIIEYYKQILDLKGLWKLLNSRIAWIEHFWLWYSSIIFLLQGRSRCKKQKEPERFFHYTCPWTNSEFIWFATFEFFTIIIKNLR